MSKTSVAKRFLSHAAERVRRSKVAEIIDPRGNVDLECWSGSVDDMSAWREFAEFSPRLDVLGIIKPGKFVKAQRTPNGDYIAYYDHIFVNAETKHTEVTTHLYGSDRGIKFCIKSFPTRHYPL